MIHRLESILCCLQHLRNTRETLSFLKVLTKRITSTFSPRSSKASGNTWKLFSANPLAH